MPTVSNIFYFSHGADNISRPPVVFIHGAGGTHLHWSPQTRRIPNYRVYALDLPAHGKSAGLGSQHIGEYARAVINFLDALKLNAAVMIGHSMGGGIALSLALDFPKRVLGLGLIGTGARLRVDPRMLESTSRAETFPAAVQLINDLEFGVSVSPRLKELARQRMSEMRPAVLHGDFLACDEFDVTNRLNEISAPTLILCGAQDQLTPPKYSEQLHTQIQNSRLAIVPQAGHMVMLEQPELFTQSAAEFLDTIPYRAGQ
ncbi:MAG: 2-hydroxy-6-oxo-6-phenylhexa-2,4-dienoate hydrolase [Anaerolineales bacterium]|nr:2-hydroxy-6-oxo-6-phenylhexa-2,4-dienoate hydrolase [Anaerolineales bacterium]